MKVIFTVFVLGLAILIINCQTNNKPVNKEVNIEKTPTPAATARPESSFSKTGVKFDVFADKERTGIRISVLEPSIINPVRIEYNGRSITERKEEDGLIEYSASFPGYEKLHRFTIADANGREYKFEAAVEPLDFQDIQPLKFYRGEANELKLSRPYTENGELWLGISESGGNGFKEIAEFNESKDAIVIPESVADRMSSGEAKIILYNGEIKKIENETFAAMVDVSYQSVIKLRVVYF